MITSKTIYQTGVFTAVFLLFFILYVLVIGLLSSEDLSLHAEFSVEMTTGERPIAGNFLLYWLVSFFSLFSTNILYAKISLCFLLATATTLRFGWALQRINEIHLFPENIKKEFWCSVLIALSLVFIFVIPIPNYFLTSYFYLGNFVPNVWHNSTTIFLFPFAIILFYQSYKQLIQYSGKRNVIIFILILINIFIKPSFFFVFICAYPIFSFIRYKFSKPFWYLLLPLFLGGLCIILEYYLIYTLDTNIDTQKSSVIISPFFAYNIYARLIILPLSIISSLLFPIVYFISNYKKLKSNILVWYIMVSLLIALLIYFTLAESGPRAGDGNFYWQIVICVWLCYFQSLIFLLKDIKKDGFSIKNKILSILYSVHVIMGFTYLIRAYFIGTYA